MVKVYIVVAGQNKGKTTYLKHLVNESKTSFGGILALSNDTKNSYYAYDVESGESRLLMSCDVASSIKIGKFGCIQDTFDWASDTALRSTKPCIVLDEVGRLELRGEGYANLLQKLLASDKTLYIAVRTDFAIDVIKTFNINDYKLINL